jgi:small subunit ribosomal protein S11
MPRSLDDFRFLRENLLVEGPDACIPSLEGFFSPFLLSPSRPSKTVLTISARRLDMFLNYLSDHPVLANHELVWEFMLMPELQVYADIVTFQHCLSLLSRNNN